jgi:hypothetical protein
MSCISDIEGRQSEFEFFQQNTQNPAVTTCCGPIVKLGFDKVAMSIFAAAMDSLGMSEDYLDLFDHEVLDSIHLTMTMCAKHWIRHAQAVSTIATHTENQEWQEFAYYIFRLTCQICGWDYKEILNFAKTAEALADEGNND